MRVLDESASGDFTLRMVAREAGVSPQAVYAHFSGREDLTFEVIRLCWQQLAEEMARASRRARTQGAMARLRAQVRAYVKYAMESPARYQLLFALRPEGIADSGHQIRPAEPAYLGILRDVEGLRDEGYRFPGLGVHDSTLALLSLMHGRVALARTAPDRAWNSARSNTVFVTRILERMFTLEHESLESLPGRVS
jgi:AcrR family transcriptional regulator